MPRSSRYLALLAVALSFTFSFAAHGQVKLTAPPVAKAAGEQIEISFTLSQGTDVEVAIVDGQGKVVRHLAAGMVGGKSVAPPLVAGLAQKLTWDKTDDLGKPAAGGPFTLRLRAGMSVGLDGFVGDGPYYVARVRGMTLDKAGTLYVLQQAYDSHFFGPYDIRVFDRLGKYVKTIMPVSANAPKEDVAAFNPVGVPGPDLTPRNFYSVWPDLYPYSQDQGLRLAPRIIGDGATAKLLLNDESFRRIYTIRASDGCAAEGQFGQDIWPKGTKLSGRCGSPMFVASADGKTLYAAGFALPPAKGEKVNADWPDGRIYKFSMAKVGEGGKEFATIEMPEKAKPPTSGWTADGNRAAINGLAVDGKGNVYAADCQNGKVHKFNADGKLLSSVAVANAFQLVVSDKSSAVYVLTCKERGAGKTLVKLGSCDADAKPLATLDLGSDDLGTPFIAGDFTGEMPQLWIATGTRVPRRPGEGTNNNPYGRTSSVLRIEDKGNQLEQVGDLAEPARFTIPGVDRLAVDPRTDDLYVNDGWYSTWRFEGLTGKYNGPQTKDGPQPIWVGSDTAVGPDGYVYIQQGSGWNGPIVRLNKDLSPAPLDGKSANVGFVFGRYGGGVGEKGICVGYDGSVYALGFYQWANYFVAGFDKTGAPMQGSRLSGKIKYGPPGQSGIVGEVPIRSGGVRVDRQGCIYVGMQGMPVGYTRPAGFEKDTAFGEMVGSVVKFKKSGGGLVDSQQPQGDVVTVGHNKLEGVEAVYPGISPFSGWLRSDACVCRGPRFDLDAYGRLYIPNAVTYSVQVVDNAGNVITTFGQYGNYDNGTATVEKSARSRIPMAWPISVAASDSRVYVGDLMNRRVIRVKPDYQVEGTCRIP